MYITFNRLLALGFTLFVVISLSLWIHDAIDVWPRKACEAKGDWWDPKGHVCAVPTSITHWTGRPIGTPPVRPAR